MYLCRGDNNQHGYNSHTHPCELGVWGNCLLSCPNRDINGEIQFMYSALGLCAIEVRGYEIQ